MRVLIVEDEAKLADVLRRGLTADGFAADVVGTGEDATWRAAATAYDVIILDVLLPGIDGFATCRELRASGINTPVLMLTARGAVRALGKLVDNALQHGSGGIVLMAEADDCGVHLAVEDSGPGFGAGPVEEPFERFRRGSDRSGTGLGLAIVRALAVAHGGSATASGRRVTLSLPRAPGRANA